MTSPIEETAPLWPGPALRMRLGRVQVVVKPSFVLLLALMWVSGWGITAFAAAAAEAWGGPTPPVSGPFAAPAMFAAAMLTTVGCHEAGHVVCGRLIGRHMVGVRVAVLPAVKLDYEVMHGWRRMLVSAAGPLFEATAGMVLVWLGGGWSDPVVLAGYVCLANAASGLVPLSRNTDGWKFWSGLSDVIRRAAW